MALTVHSSAAAQPLGAPLPEVGRPRSPRVFRAFEIPLGWDKQFLSDELQKRYPSKDVRVHSLYKDPTGSSSTALVTFNYPPPDALSNPEGHEFVNIDGNEIILGNCEGLTTLYEPEEAESREVE